MKEKTRRCKYCKSEVKIEIGLHNWKNLFRKPTLEDYITLFIILMLLFSAYTYKSDLNTIINYYENETYCNTKRNINPQGNTNPFFLINFSINSNNSSNLSIKKDE